MAVQPGPVPRGPTGHILKHLLAVSQEGELGLQVVDVGFLGYRLAGRFQTLLRWPLAGPQVLGMAE